MKTLTIIILGTVLLMGCDRTSSPDGRSQIRDENIQQQIDSLKAQTNALKDSINQINLRLKAQ